MCVAQGCLLITNARPLGRQLDDGPHTPGIVTSAKEMRLSYKESII
jgi:hypothetical protein